MSQCILEIRNLYKEYISKNGSILANDNINLSINKGEIIAFLGPNGAGKSTLIKQIIGYLSPTSGTIELFGENIQNKKEDMLDKIGYMMQSRYDHWDHLSVKDALFYTGRLKKLSKSEIKEQMNYLTEKLELTGELDRIISYLSGGKRQSVALACAVIGNPEIVILDEPTNGLDPEKRMVLWNFLKELNSERQTTIIIITHNVNEIESISDRVIIVGHAKVLRDGTPAELREELKNKMRIEINFENDQIFKNGFTIEEFHSVWSEDKQTIYIYVSEQDAVTCLSNILNNKNINADVKNIQFYKPTLEDIYIKVMGEKIND